MNKTVNINIGGLFFHIDEDAYQKLSRYFDAIKRSLSNSSGKDEIMKDIEMRVAELFTERQKSDSPDCIEHIEPIELTTPASRVLRLHSAGGTGHVAAGHVHHTHAPGAAGHCTGFRHHARHGAAHHHAGLGRQQRREQLR